jgi:biotin carboxyl carrier protein
MDGQVLLVEMRTRGSIESGRESTFQAGLRAPMPATVIKVLVAEGQNVRKGETLVLLESMKMEFSIQAPAAGRVANVNCQPGQLVNTATELVGLQYRD